MTRSRKRKLRRTQAAMATSLATTMVTGIPAALAQETGGGLPEIIVTAQKRAESLQNVPLSIQALDTAKLQELHVTNFDDYVKFLPSVASQSDGPGFAHPYFRGVASGENNNHSGPLPTVGMYLDEQPITTIQGALDIHIYDIARVEALAGPQGTLYGASSMAGTIRIITNKPDPGGFSAGYDVEANGVDHGDFGWITEGFVNQPLSSNAAIRLVGWYQRDGGYIDNRAGTRTYPTSGACISNSDPPASGCLATPAHARNDYNNADTYGARAALKIDLSDNWTITPTLMAQEQKTNGSFAFDPSVGDLALTHFDPENSVDHWVQAALAVEGKISDFDLLYAGAYLHRADETNLDYSDYSYWYDVKYGYGAYWTDSTGTPLADISQFIQGKDGYQKQSHELRISSPQDKRFRFVGGLFVQRQDHNIFQNYKITGLDPALTVGYDPTSMVTRWPNSIWLTNQTRVDKDYAVFGELSYDILPKKLTLTGGFRVYKYDNSLKGYQGFGLGYYNPTPDDPPVNVKYGEALCALQQGTPQVAPPFTSGQFNGAPCTNVDAVTTGRGTVPKGTLTWHIDDDRMVYATYSKGFRPGGINRNSSVPPYRPDYLYNYEIGWKTTWADNRLRFNGATFIEKWDAMQFSTLPPGGAGLTVIQNAGEARIIGIESDLTWVPVDRLTLSGGFMLVDAELTRDFVATGGEVVPSGIRLPVTPKFKGNLTGRYEFFAGSYDSHFQGSLIYSASAWSDLLPSDRAVVSENDAYFIADFSAGVAKNGYSVEMYLNNALDTRAEQVKFVECDAAVCGAQPYTVPNRPRTIGIRFGQKF